MERTIAGLLKPRGFRKRGRNWFRTTSANEYQVVNLQKSSWGGGNCYLNLGWDPAVPAGEFRSENQCAVTLRAEDTDVIPPIDWVRPDGLTTLELPGISLLDTEANDRMSEAQFAKQFSEVIAVPIADLLDRTPSIVDLVPLLTAKPWFATRALRDELSRRGLELPTSW
jgi:Domain of unknown function (DUF4304)